MINEVHCLVGKQCLCLFFKIGLKWFFAVILTARLSLRQVAWVWYCEKEAIVSEKEFWVLQVPLLDDDMNDNEMDKNFNRNSAEPKSKLAKIYGMQNNLGNVEQMNKYQS